MTPTFADLGTDQRAKLLGLVTYDTALPQDWVDEFRRLTDFNPVGQIVWCYDDAKIFGEPVATTVQAQRALLRFTRQTA